MAHLHLFTIAFEQSCKTFQQKLIDTCISFVKSTLYFVQKHLLKGVCLFDISERDSEAGSGLPRLGGLLQAAVSPPLPLLLPAGPPLLALAPAPVVKLEAAVGEGIATLGNLELEAVLRPHLHRRGHCVAGAHYIGEGPVGSLAVLHTVLAAEPFSAGIHTAHEVAGAGEGSHRSGGGDGAHQRQQVRPHAD